MTRKDFTRVANALNKLVTKGENKSSIATIVSELCDVFEDTNPRFDRDKFIKAVWQVPKMDNSRDKDTLCEHYECNALRQHAMRYIPDFNRADIECFTHTL